MTDLLAGTRVLELGSLLTAHCGRWMADMGADVVLAEPPGGSSLRWRPPLLPTPTGAALGAEFAYTAAGKRSVTVDLTDERGRQVARGLVATVDVVLVDDTVLAGERALCPADLRRDHPRLVYASVTPFGLSGPRRYWKGSDLIAWATTGVMPGIGDADRPPLTPRSDLATVAAGLNALLGVLAALHARERSGVGQLVDVSCQEAALSVALETSAFHWADVGATPSRAGKRRAAGPTGHFRTMDGAVVIVAFTPWQWDGLAEWIADECGIPQVRDPRYRGTPPERAPYAELINGWVEALTLRYCKQDFMEEAQRRGIPTGPVNTAVDLLQDPHLRETGGWAETSTADGWRVPVPTPALLVDGHSLAVGAIPDPGQDDDEVLGRALGTS